MPHTSDFEHPSDLNLRAYAFGVLSLEQCASLESHLQSCRNCSERFDAISLARDSFVGKLRNVPVSDNRLIATLDLPAGDASPAESDSTVDLVRSEDTQNPDSPQPASDPSWPVIAGYQITSIIARGGMGCVYAARDLTLDRAVAIKTLLPRAKPERFITEAKITSKLPHPGIPPVHALGKLNDGSPYLVMKLIQGRTLAELLSEFPNGMGSQEQLGKFLQIFEQIALAVGFAHSQSILHRDLKPLNVMVGAFGEVQVMDWGLAKELGGTVADAQEFEAPVNETTERLELTFAGAIMGTPGYMSPEQARGEAVDARTDVFSLGALLTTILTGKPAFTGATSREIVQRAAKADLAETFTRLQSSGAPQEAIELALKCLAPARADRPADASAVAQTVAHYRANVVARLRKSETEQAEAAVRASEERKRRRGLMIAAAAIAALLLIGVVGLSVGLWTLNGKNQALATANANLIVAKRQADDATIKEKKAHEAAKGRLKQLTVNNQALGSIFKDLDMRKVSWQGKTLEQSLGNRLLNAAKFLEAESVGDPLVVADLQLALATPLQSFGYVKEGIALLEACRATRTRLLGDKHPDTLTSMNHLSMAYLDDGRTELAWSLLAHLNKPEVEGLETEETVLKNRNNLALVYVAQGKLQAATQLHEAVLERQLVLFGEDHLDTLMSLNNLGGAYQQNNLHRKAIPLLEKAVDISSRNLGRNHPYTLSSMSNLGLAYGAARQYQQAMEIQEETYALRCARFGRKHPETLTSMNNLGLCYLHLKQIPEAVTILTECVELCSQAGGPDHPDTFSGMGNLATALYEDGQVDRAIAVGEEALALMEANREDHSDTLIHMDNLAQWHQRSGRLDRAIELFEKQMKLVEKREYNDYFAFLSAQKLVAALELNQQYPQAEVWRRKLIDRMAARGAQETEYYANELQGLGRNLSFQENWPGAEAAFKDCHSLMQRLKPKFWATHSVGISVARSLMEQEKNEQAAPLLLSAYQGLHEQEATLPQPGLSSLNFAVRLLIDVYTVLDQPLEVAKWKKVQEEQALPKKKQE